MRFRSFNHFPSWGGYIQGHSFWRTCAYSVASDMGRKLDRPAEIRAAGERVCRNLEIKMNLMKAGILPWPGQKKATVIAPRSVHTAYVASAWKSAPASAVVSETIRESRPKPVVSRPAAVKANGGLRGSTASRWR